MVVDTMRIAVDGKRYSVLTIKMCSRWIRRHPVLMATLCVLVFLYRSFPFCFSVLVSASPVLICTALLLGALLSFGDPHIPEIDLRNDPHPELVATTTTTHHDINLFEKHGTTTTSSSEDHVSVVQRADNEVGSVVEMKGSVIEEEDRIPVVVEAKSREIQFAEQVEKVFSELEMKMRKKEEDNAGVSENHQYARVGDLGDGENNGDMGIDEDGSSKSTGEFLASQSGNRAMEEKHEEEEECEECSEDSGSDGAESSSPDASMADIMPMLDELHPLLDEEAPQQGLISHYGSASEGSHRNRSSSSVDSEEDSGNHVDEDEEEEEEEESEGVQTGKEDESKSAIVWTEDDTKNLMDLGTSELERNQRLESLIARRRARRNSRAVIEKEKNLIDFDSGSDLHFNVPPISTSRRNPFDLPYDSYDDAPGSAPSIMLKRRNPFDLPYDSGEEKPDLKGESSDLEFTVFQNREQQPGQVFRRHDSFNVGPSYLGGVTVPPPPNKQERLDVRWKPYFLPERFVHNHEGATATTTTTTTSSSSSSFPGHFQRQFSEVSDSKMSSIPDTESVVSVLEEEEDKKKLVSEKDAHQEMESEELIASNVDTSSVLVEHGSLSSSSVDGVGDDDAEVDERRRRDVHHHHHHHHHETEIEETDITNNISGGNVETNHEMDSPSGGIDTIIPVQMNASEILMRMVEPSGDEEYSSLSSLSSSSEQGDEKITEGQKVLLTNREMKVEVPSTQTLLHVGSHPENDSLRVSLDTLDRHSVGSTVDESKHEEPVFDSSPPALDKFLSFSSISSDIQAEIAEMAEKAYLNKKGFFQLDQDDRMDLSSSHPSTAAEQDEEVKVVTSQSSDHQVQWSEKSMVGPSFKNRDELLELSVRKIESVPKDSELTLERSSPTEAFWSPESAGSFNFEEDEMKEIDEGLLSELDAVGDFRVKEVDGEQQTVQTSSNMQDRGTEHSPEENSHKFPETNVEGDIHTRELPVLEVRTAEDIDLAFKQLHEGAEVEEVILPSAIKLQQELEKEDRFGSPDVQPSTPLQVIEARFVDDIHVAVMQQVSKGSGKDLPEPSDSLQVTTEETSLTELPVLEVRTAEDIDLAFKQLHEGAEVEEVILPSAIKQQQSLEEEDKFGSPNAQPSTPMQVVEAKMLEDIHFAVMQQASKGSGNEDLPGASDSASRQLSEDELSIPNKELPVLEVKTAEDIDLAFKQLHEGAEVEEVILPSTIKQQSLEDEFGSPDVQPSTPLQVVDARFIEDIHAAVRQQASKSTDNGTPKPSESIAIRVIEKEISSTELPVLEVRTAEDIDLAFKQLHEGAEVEDVILPSTIEQQSADDEFRSPSEQPSTPLQVVEARFIEDIHAAVMRQGSKGSDREFRETSSTGIQVTKMEVHDKELPVLEVRTAEDIDLAFKQLHEGAKLEEVILPSSIELQAAAEDEFRSPSEQPSTPLQVVEARFIEDIHAAVMQQGSKGSDREFRETSSTGIQVTKEEVHDKELPVLEVRTAEDIDLAFKQLHEGAKLEEVILPSSIELQAAAEDEFRSPSEQPSTPLQVVEARFIEDIDAAVMQQGSKGSDREFRETSSTGIQVTKEEVHDKELPVLEVRTAEDIDLAFKQLHEGAKLEEVILPSSIELQAAAEDEFRSPSEQPSTPLPVVEARFIEDIHAAVMQQASKGNEGGLPEPSDLVGTQFSKDEVTDKELPVLEVRTAEDIDLAFKQLHEGAELEEVILPSTIKQQALEDEFRSPDEQPSTPLHVVEAKHIDDIHVAVLELASKSSNPSLPAPSVSAESQLTEEQISGEELPVLEVKTAEDIDLAFKQLHEGAELDEVILPSTIKQRSVEYELGSPNEPPSTPLQVVDARFVEDIDAAVMQQSFKGNAMELPHVSASRQAENTQVDHSHQNDLRNPEGEEVLPVLEVRTAEDIDLAFKQLHEGAEVNEVIVPSHIKQRSLEEDEFRSPDEQPSTPLQVVDARFLEDIHTAVAQHGSKDNDKEVQKAF